MIFWFTVQNSIEHDIEITASPYRSGGGGGFEKPWTTSETFRSKTWLNVEKFLIWHSYIRPFFSNISIWEGNHSQLQLPIIVQKRLVSNVWTFDSLFSLTGFKPSNLHCEVNKNYITQSNIVCRTLITCQPQYARRKRVSLRHNRMVGDLRISTLNFFRSLIIKSELICAIFSSS